MFENVYNWALAIGILGVVITKSLHLYLDWKQEKDFQKVLVNAHAKRRETK